MRKKVMSLILALSICLTAVGCGAQTANTTPLDPQQPTTVVLWNYYNGQTKAAFDTLVEQFNETVGMEAGVVVDSVSHGDLQQLATSVYDAASGAVGAEGMPHVFGAYPDNVYRVDQLGAVANMEPYFTEEELSAYRQDFLRDCRLGEDNGLKVLPAARSTDVFYLNRTDWDRFAQATRAELSQLETWEGVAEVAEQYYRWTDNKTPKPGDGKAFFGLDSFANFIISASVQLGCDVYEVEGQTGTFHFEQAFARKMWDVLYVPFINGYYANYGRFRSDDAKTGDILAYIGSSAGAQYFPMEIALSQDETYAAEGLTLPYPSFSGGEPCAIAQGAGFAVGKSDAVHEYAAVLFLKWFTAPAQNTQFALNSGYLPVQNAALEQDLGALAEQFNQGDLDSPTIAQSIATTQTMLESYTLYANRSFEGSYELRALMERTIIDRVRQDQTQLAEQVAAGASRQAVIAQLTGDEGFAAWYTEFMDEADHVLGI